MREVILRLFFQGHATAADLAFDLEHTVSRQGPDGGPPVFRHRVENMEVDFEVQPGHIVQLIDAVASGGLGLADLDALCFCIEASDRFVWSTDTPDGARVATALFWLGTPEINYPLTPGVLAKIRHFLVDGENTLTRQDAESPRSPARQRRP